MTPRREWRSTGFSQDIDPAGRSIPDYDPRSSEHYWVVASVYNVNPTLWTDDNHTPMLDSESLRYISPAFCYHCEEPFTPHLSALRCAGGPGR